MKSQLSPQAIKRPLNSGTKKFNKLIAIMFINGGFKRQEQQYTKAIISLGVYQPSDFLRRLFNTDSIRSFET